MSFSLVSAFTTATANVTVPGAAGNRSVIMGSIRQGAGLPGCLVGGVTPSGICAERVPDPNLATPIGFADRAQFVVNSFTSKDVNLTVNQTAAYTGGAGMGFVLTVPNRVRMRVLASHYAVCSGSGYGISLTSIPGTTTLSHRGMLWLIAMRSSQGARQINGLNAPAGSAVLQNATALGNNWFGYLVTIPDTSGSAVPAALGATFSPQADPENGFSCLIYADDVA